MTNRKSPLTIRTNLANIGSSVLSDDGHDDMAFETLTQLPTPLINTGSFDGSFEVHPHVDQKKTPAGDLTLLRTNAHKQGQEPDLMVHKRRSPRKVNLGLESSQRIVSDFHPNLNRPPIGSRIASTPLASPINDKENVPDELELCEDDVLLHDRPYVVRTRNDRIISYHYVKRLGKGAFSTVILAELDVLVDEEPQQVAIKVIDLDQYSQLDNFKDAILRELKVLHFVDHPTITQLLGVSPSIDIAREIVSPTENLIVLPYSQGGNLLEFAKLHHQYLVMNPVVIQRIFAELLAGLTYLHRHNYVHRDIKLENILINVSIEDLLNSSIENWKDLDIPLINIADFGLSKEIDVENPLLTTRCGSEDYVAPELLMGVPYDGRLTDVWACGVILYCLFEDRLPFDPPLVANSTISPSSLRRQNNRSRNVHRIAMIQYKYYYLETGFDEVKEIIGKCLIRKEKRAWSGELIKMPFINDVLPQRFV